jgi:hypothetical protein
MEVRKIVSSNELYHYGVKGMKWRHKKGAKSYEYIKEKKRHEDEQEAKELEIYNKNVYQQGEDRLDKNLIKERRQRKQDIAAKRSNRAWSKLEADSKGFSIRSKKANKYKGEQAVKKYQDKSIKSVKTKTGADYVRMYQDRSAKRKSD